MRALWGVVKSPHAPSTHKDLFQDFSQCPLAWPAPTSFSGLRVNVPGVLMPAPTTPIISQVSFLCVSIFWPAFITTWLSDCLIILHAHLPVCPSLGSSPRRVRLPLILDPLCLFQHQPIVQAEHILQTVMNYNLMVGKRPKAPSWSPFLVAEPPPAAEELGACWWVTQRWMPPWSWEISVIPRENKTPDLHVSHFSQAGDHRNGDATVLSWGLMTVKKCLLRTAALLDQRDHSMNYFGEIFLLVNFFFYH
jgi:hypothetical protein